MNLSSPPDLLRDVLHEGLAIASESPDRTVLSQAWANVAAPVAVVTLRDRDGMVHGTTITAFTSISFEPAVLMISLLPTSSFLARLSEMSCGMVDGDNTGGATFSLNVLSSTQEEVGTVCATKAADKLAGVPIDDQRWGPFIVGASASFGCCVNNIVSAGDHRLVFARIEHAVSASAQSGLLYWQRQFGFSEIVS